MREYSVGVDLGGTNLRVAAIDRDGTIIDKVSGVTQHSAGREAILADLVAAVERVKTAAGYDGLRGVGIGMPGYIQMETGTVLSAANLPMFTGFAMRDELQRRLHTPVLLENDANAAALGESWRGAGKHVKELILGTLGTGVGGGSMVNGRGRRGRWGMAGEFGHMTVVPQGNPCGCGNHGCLEKHASATALIAMAHMLQLDAVQSARDVYHLAEQGNERALRCFEYMGVMLGIALASLINIFNFSLYLLAGGVVAGWKFFAPSMFSEVERRSVIFTQTKPQIAPAALGNEAGLYGAAYLPLLLADGVNLLGQE